MADKELFGISEQLEKDHFADHSNMVGDTISRAAAIDAIKEDKIDLTDPSVVAVFKATGDFEKVETQVMTCDRHIKILKDLPSAQKKGHWIDEGTNYSCSECHRGCWVNSNYCPWCGAQMDGKDGDQNG